MSAGKGNSFERTRASELRSGEARLASLLLSERGRQVLQLEADKNHGGSQEDAMAAMLSQLTMRVNERWDKIDRGELPIPSPIRTGKKTPMSPTSPPISPPTSPTRARPRKSPRSATPITRNPSTRNPITRNPPSPSPLVRRTIFAPPVPPEELRGRKAGRKGSGKRGGKEGGKRRDKGDKGGGKGGDKVGKGGDKDDVQPSIAPKDECKAADEYGQPSPLPEDVEQLLKLSRQLEENVDKEVVVMPTDQTNLEPSQDLLRLYRDGDLVQDDTTSPTSPVLTGLDLFGSAMRELEELEPEKITSGRLKQKCTPHSSEMDYILDRVKQSMHGHPFESSVASASTSPPHRPAHSPHNSIVPTLEKLVLSTDRGGAETRNQSRKDFSNALNAAFEFDDVFEIFEKNGKSAISTAEARAMRDFDIMDGADVPSKIRRHPSQIMLDDAEPKKDKSPCTHPRVKATKISTSKITPPSDSANDIAALAASANDIVASAASANDIAASAASANDIAASAASANKVVDNNRRDKGAGASSQNRSVISKRSFEPAYPVWTDNVCGYLVKLYANKRKKSKKFYYKASRGTLLVYLSANSTTTHRVYDLRLMVGHTLNDTTITIKFADSEDILMLKADSEDQAKMWKDTLFEHRFYETVFIHGETSVRRAAWNLNHVRANVGISNCFKAAVVYSSRHHHHYTCIKDPNTGEWKTGNIFRFAEAVPYLKKIVLVNGDEGLDSIVPEPLDQQPRFSSEAARHRAESTYVNRNVRRAGKKLRKLLLLERGKVVLLRYASNISKGKKVTEDDLRAAYKLILEKLTTAARVVCMRKFRSAFPPLAEI